MATVRAVLLGFHRRTPSLHSHTPSFLIQRFRYYRSSLLPQHIRLKMPSVGEDVAGGEIVVWHKSVGDAVKQNEPVCEIDLDTMSLDLAAEEDGYLAEVSVPTGVKVASGTTIGRQVRTQEELATFVQLLRSSRESAEKDLIFAYRILADLGYDDYMNLNHVSVWIPSTEHPWKKVMVTSKPGFCWHNITNKDLRDIDVMERLQTKKTGPNIEMMDIYCQLIQKTPTINSVIHVNTESLLSFACMSPNQLMLINPMCARFLNRIMYVDHLEEVYLGGFITVANIIVIRNYGVIVTGSSMEQAFDTFFYFEHLVRLQLGLIKLQSSNPNISIHEMDAEELEQLQQKYQENSYQLAKEHFDARKRSVLEKSEVLMQQVEHDLLR